MSSDDGLSRRGRKAIASPSSASTPTESAFPNSASPSPPRRRSRASSRRSVAEVGFSVEAAGEEHHHYYAEPRSFPHSVKQQCWEKAEKVKGRDPDRWRRDAVGNLIFRKLVGCAGCLCHDYDHIIPFSKGGKSTLENCQVLQAKVNRSKGNSMDMSKAELIQKSAYCKVSGRDMDMIEVAAYGNVQRGQNSGGCNIQ